MSNKQEATWGPVDSPAPDPRAVVERVRIDPDDVQQLLQIVATFVANRDALRPRVAAACAAYDATEVGQPFDLAVSVVSLDGATP